jgi:hypothetical protein
LHLKFPNIRQGQNYRGCTGLEYCDGWEVGREVVRSKLKSKIITASLVVNYMPTYIILSHASHSFQSTRLFCTNSEYQSEDLPCSATRRQSESGKLSESILEYDCGWRSAPYEADSPGIGRRVVSSIVMEFRCWFGRKKRCRLRVDGLDHFRNLS